MYNRARFFSFLFFFSLVSPFSSPFDAGAYAQTATETRPSTVELTGSVVDPDGLPLGGARVLVVIPSGLVRETVTEDGGHFRILVPAAEWAEVRVEHAGFRAVPVRISPRTQRAPLAIRLSLTGIGEALTVTASQVEVPQSQTATHVTLLDREDLRAQHSESLSDALRLVPGLTVSSTGGRGALATMFTRGGESDYTLVLVDGVRVNNFGGLFDAGQLPLEGVDRVEIARGPQSALFGSDAIGGVVHVVSRRDRLSRGEASVEVGSFGTRRTAGHGAFSRGGWLFGASAEQQMSDGLSDRAATTGALVSNDDYSRTSGRVSARRESSRGSVSGHIRMANNDRGVPGPFGQDPGGTFSGVDTVSRTRNGPREVALGLAHAVTPTTLVRAQVSHARARSRFTSPYGISEAFFDRTTARATGDVSPWPLLAASVGVEHTTESAESSFILGNNAEIAPVRRGLTGLFGEVRLTWSDRLFVSTGLRVEHITRAQLSADPAAFPPRPLLPDDEIWSANPKLSVSFRPGRPATRLAQWRATLNAGTGIRPPDAFELAFTDNPSLRPERTRSADLGLEHTAWRGRVITEGVAFFNRYDDLIVAVGRSFANVSQFRTANLSNARTRGLELASTLATATVRLRAGYTWLSSAVLAVDGTGNLAPAPFAVGQPLVRRPRHQASILGSWTKGHVAAYSRLQLRGRTLDIDPSFGAFGGTFENTGFAVVDLGGSMRWGPALQISVRALNLFGEQYEEVLGFPALGRQLILGVRVASRD